MCCLCVRVCLHREPLRLRCDASSVTRSFTFMLPQKLEWAATYIQHIFIYLTKNMLESENQGEVKDGWRVSARHKCDGRRVLSLQEENKNRSARRKLGETARNEKNKKGVTPVLQSKNKSWLNSSAAVKRTHLCQQYTRNKTILVHISLKYCAGCKKKTLFVHLLTAHHIWGDWKIAELLMRQECLFSSAWMGI